jgi:hypothetical protein
VGQSAAERLEIGIGAGIPERKDRHGVRPRLLLRQGRFLGDRQFGGGLQFTPRQEVEMPVDLIALAAVPRESSGRHELGAGRVERGQLFVRQAEIHVGGILSGSDHQRTPQHIARALELTGLEVPHAEAGHAFGIPGVLLALRFKRREILGRGARGGRAAAAGRERGAGRQCGNPTGDRHCNPGLRELNPMYGRRRTWEEGHKLTGDQGAVDWNQAGRPPDLGRTPPPEGRPVGRRGIKEYRAAEALVLISADRDRRPLVCPSCGAASVQREPRNHDEPTGRVTLTCRSCGRVASYLVRASLSLPEDPRQS